MDAWLARKPVQLVMCRTLSAPAAFGTERLSILTFVLVARSTKQPRQSVSGSVQGLKLVMKEFRLSPPSQITYKNSGTLPVIITSSFHSLGELVEELIFS